MSGRILIADAQPTNRITLKVRLTAACHDVTTAATLPDLLAQARERRVDLIVLGGPLPGHDVAGVCARLRAEDATAGVPLLVLCPAEARLGAMRAGAAAVLDQGADEFMLLARVRGLLRDTAPAGFAEPAAVFAMPAVEDSLSRVALVAESPARALSWKHALARHLPARFVICDAEQALAATGAGPADLYVISADLEGRGDGLRLLSELRSRPMSRDAAFVLAVPEGRPDLAAIALDLGAGDTITPDLADPAQTELAAIALSDQIARKGLADRRRAEAQQNLIWSITDPLTGLYNRRYALPRLAEALGAAGSTGRDCAVLAIDADHFKRINDRFGHAAGDRVLIELARRIEAATGPHGLVARMGGEEFVAILPGAGAAEAAARAQAIAAAITAHPVPLPVLTGGGVVAVTVSIGVATLQVEDQGRDPAEAAEVLLHRADRALHHAKRAGRNRIVSATVDQAA